MSAYSIELCVEETFVKSFITKKSLYFWDRGDRYLYNMLQKVWLKVKGFQPLSWVHLRDYGVLKR